MRRKLLAACLFVAMGTSTAMAQDWPQWRGPDRDARAASFNAPETWPKDLKKGWSVDVGSGDASPSLVGDKLYVFTKQGGDEVLACLNAADGKEVWKEKYPTVNVSGPAGGHAGPRASPAVADGKVVTLGVGGVVSCFDAATGKLAWRNSDYKDVPMFYTSLSPIVVDGLAIVHLGGGRGGGGTIVGFDLATGNQKWKQTAASPGYASPVLLTVDGTRQVASLTDRSVIGVAVTDGKVLWELPFAGQRRAYNASTPIVMGQTVIYAGGGRGTFAVNIEKDGDKFAAKQLWSNADTAPQFNTPVVKDGFLYGLSERSNLYCIDLKTGKTTWTDGTRLSQYGAIVDAGGVLVALPESGQLIVFKPDGKAFTQVASYKVCDRTYSYPVLSGKRIFVKDANSLTLWTVE